MRVQTEVVFSSLSRIFKSKIHISSSQMTILQNSLVFESNAAVIDVLKKEIEQEKSNLDKLYLMHNFINENPTELITLLVNDDYINFNIHDILEMISDVVPNLLHQVQKVA